MKYMSTGEAAAKWGVSLRQVQRLLAAGRLPNAKKYGRAWMIPAGADKPGDPRHELRAPQHTLQDALNRAIDSYYAIFMSYPRTDPYRILDAFFDKKLRLVAEAVFAYMRGDFEQTRQFCAETMDDDVARLVASPIVIAASITSGDYPFFLETENWLKNIVNADLGAGVTAFAQQALAIGYLGAAAPSMVPEWIKNGHFSDLHPLIRFEASHRRAAYLQRSKKYQSMLDTAQTALSMLGLVYSEQAFSLVEINLRIACAIACHGLGYVDEAKHRLISAMDIALPHGFIMPFALAVSDLCGLMEQCLKQAYPQWHDAVLEQESRSGPNWVGFHNRFTKDNIPSILTRQEYEVAKLVILGMPRAKIAERLHYSVGWVNYTLETIYGKLLINSRKELAKFTL
jgi:excisionase family DNA binding protein